MKSKSEIIQNLQIIHADSQHSRLFPECLALLDRTQGKGVFTLEYLQHCASESDRMLLIALLNGGVVGVASALLLPKDGFNYYLPFGKEAVDLFQQNRVGSMGTASVMESLQGHGVGQELTRLRIQWLREAGCTTIIGVSWESGLAHTSKRVFRKFGFSCLSQATGFYSEASILRGFLCPVCGSPPCQCSARLYVKHITPIVERSCAPGTPSAD